MDSFKYSDYITSVKVKPLESKLSLRDNIYITGSCFATNIYKILDNYCLNVTLSPFGNVYNPLSISSTLNRVIENKKISEAEIIYNQGIYQHHDFHSSMGKSDIKEFIESVNSSIQESHNKLVNSNAIIITLGTAYVYEKNSCIVNNCHKLSSKEFTRRVLSVDEIVEQLSKTLISLIKINNSIKIIFTLSPVRHLRDDATENSLSKSLLRVAIDQLVNKFNLYYFPSYEILLDELRDYRWYDDSLTHPNNQSIHIISSKFFYATFDDRFNKYIKQYEKLQTMLCHKIMNRESEEAKKFELKRENYLCTIQSEYKELPRLKNIRSSQYS